MNPTSIVTTFTTEQQLCQDVHVSMQKSLFIQLLHIGDASQHHSFIQPLIHWERALGVIEAAFSAPFLHHIYRYIHKLSRIYMHTCVSNKRSEFHVWSMWFCIHQLSVSLSARPWCDVPLWLLRINEFLQLQPHSPAYGFRTICA